VLSAVEMAPLIPLIAVRMAAHLLIGRSARAEGHCCHPPACQLPTARMSVVPPLGVRCVRSVRDGTRRCGPSVGASIHRLVSVMPIWYDVICRFGMSHLRRQQ
jgi:hypothetical protein